MYMYILHVYMYMYVYYLNLATNHLQNQINQHYIQIHVHVHYLLDKLMSHNQPSAYTFTVHDVVQVKVYIYMFWCPCVAMCKDAAAASGQRGVANGRGHEGGRLGGGDRGGRGRRGVAIGNHQEGGPSIQF